MIRPDARRDPLVMTFSFRMLTLLSLLAASALAARAQDRAGHELQYPPKDFAKLDTFEGLNLEDADRLFNKKDYRGAYSAYKAYTDEFAKGRALSYAILRMGRCLHLLKKRNAAVRVYQEVVDYFPNDVRYAAGALYHMGQAHLENGDEKKCLATWAKMVKDKDYAKQPNSGTALEHLAKAMDKAKKYEEAAKYRWRTAVAFRSTNHRAAEDARRAVRYHYVVRSPNHEKFKKFYKECGGFHRDRKLDDLDNSHYYWRTVFDAIIHDRIWNNQDREHKKRAARYWPGRLGANLPKDDHVQMQRINTQYFDEEDVAKWEQRINDLFESNAPSVKRLRWFAGEFRGRAKQQFAFLDEHAPLLKGAGYADIMDVIRQAHESFRGKLFGKYLASSVRGLKIDEKIKMLHTLTAHNMRMPMEAGAVLRSIDLGTVTDDQLVTLAAFAARVNQEEPAVLRYFSAMRNKQHSTKARYDYYYAQAHPHHRCNRAMAEKALAEVARLVKMPKYSQAVLWPKAELLRGCGRLEEAIKAYKAANRQPDSTWRVTDCLIALKQYEKAIKTVKVLESVGGGVASQACFKVADIHRMSGNKGKEIEQLRLVLRRYPKSRESSEAHQRLENYGAKVTGGQSRAED